MTTINTDNARGGVESRQHRVLKVLGFSLVAALVIMLGFLAFG